MSEGTFEPKIIAFLCNWCSYRAADLAGTSRTPYPPNVRAIRVMCSGRVDPAFVIEAFSRGADGVILAGCHPGECHYLEQNYKAMRRYAMLRHSLRSLGIEGRRLRLVWASAAEGHQLAQAFTSITEEVRELGPLDWSATRRESEEQREAVDRIADEHAEASEVRP